MATIIERISNIFQKAGSVNPLTWAITDNFSKFFSDDLISTPKRDLASYYRSWNKVAIDVIAGIVSNTEFKLYKYNKKGDKEEVKDHPILDALYLPNDYQSKTEFFFSLQALLLIYGKAPVHKVKIGSKYQLIPLDPNSLKPVKDKNGQIIKYSYEKDGAERSYDVTEIIPFKTFSLLNFDEGDSSTLKAIYPLESMIELENWQLKTLRNGMTPSFMLVMKDKLSQAQMDEVKAKILQNFAGSQNAGQPLVFSMQNGADYIKTGLSFADFNASTLEEALRDKILGMYGVPKSMAGVTEDINVSNYEASEQAFLKHNIVPKLNLIIETFNRYFVSEIDESLYLDYEDVLREDEKLKAEINQIATGSSAWKTPNEVRQEEGLDPIDGGDVLKPTSTNPFQLDPSTNNTDSTKELDEAKRVNKKNERAIRNLNEQIRSLKDLLPQAAQRDAMKKALEARAVQTEQHFIKLFHKYAKSLQKRIIEKLTSQKSIVGIKKAIVENVYNSEEEVALIFDIMKRFYKFAANESLNDALDQLDIAEPMDLDKKIELILERRAQSTSKLISDTTYHQLQKTLSEGLENGESVEELKKRVQAVCGDIIDSRTYAIATTETTKINGLVTQDTYERLQVPYKEWVSIHDDRTRDAHAGADGYKVRMDQKFLVGGDFLDAPGDPDGSAENVINCRCRIIGSFTS